MENKNIASTLAAAERFLRKYSWTVAAAVAVLALAMFLVATCIGRKAAPPDVGAPREPLTMYDIPYERYELVEGEIGAGETMGRVLERFGVGAGGTYRIEQAARDIFDMRNVRAGNRYVAMLTPDTLSTDTVARPRLTHFVYEKSQTDYAVISMWGGPVAMGGDSIAVRNGSKPVRIERRRITAEITSSMWMALYEAGLPDALSAELEDIYGWSVDFFALQKGDRFEVIYDQRFIDSVEVSRNGVGMIWGSVFRHGGKDLYAIPFIQDGKTAYWDENGNSLKKQFLKAPLNYSRISSRFSNARRHPITRIVRPHHGVDYAAPTGTPVRAVADGTVTRRYWEPGGGNTVWIRHARGYETGYLHLSRFGAGIAVGTRVSQGQTIGYVGSTGQSTGPHLDYRIRVNGKPTDPLKIPQEPGLPVREADRGEFAFVRSKVMGELAGTLPEAERLARLDSIVVPTGVELGAVVPSAVDTTKNIIDGGR
ncbi:MAG: peptidoglycan DD-metalloendopeptidase family protein [Alistipes sp.]|jgi:murein DD-endopeptidase MepM/ murein hydrolase activator NlpD|nr:peptidoglycan DD-metalloendopeptidase family protein [Alistipes sp.]